MLKAAQLEMVTAFKMHNGHLSATELDLRDSMARLDRIAAALESSAVSTLHGLQEDLRVHLSAYRNSLMASHKSVSHISSGVPHMADGLISPARSGTEKLGARLAIYFECFARVAHSSLTRRD